MNLPFGHNGLLSATVVLFALGLSVMGQTAETHRIDIAQAKCLKTSKGTMPRAKCYSDAADAWEKDVADTFAKLLKVTEGENKKSLEASQTAWEAYRDAEFDLIAQVYGRRKGSGYIAVRITLRSEILRTRAIRLENWLDTFKPSE